MATLPVSQKTQTISSRMRTAASKRVAAREQRKTPRLLSVSQAKTHLIALLNDVEEGREPITITKRGRPVAMLVPIENEAKTSAFGCMKGTFKITGDIVGPEPDEWEAMQ